MVRVLATVLASVAVLSLLAAYLVGKEMMTFEDPFTWDDWEEDE